MDKKVQIALVIIIAVVVIIIIWSLARKQSCNRSPRSSPRSQGRLLVKGRGKSRSHSSESGSFPEFKDIWNEGVGDTGARSFAKRSTKLTPKGAKRLALKYKTFIATSPTQAFQMNESVTIMKDTIYLTTQNPSTFGPLLGDSSGNYVIAIRRSDGEILWQRNFADYTGGPRDYCRGAPSVDGDRMYLLSNNVFGHFQSSADPDNPSVDLNMKFAGTVPATGSGRRNAGIVCVNRHTGDLIWYKQYGKVAKSWNDPDNFRSFGMSGTVIPEVDISGSGSRIPIFVAGTNHVGQYFYGSVLLQDRPGGNKVGATVQRRLRSYSSQGQVTIVNGLTGDLIVEVPTAPRNLLQGEVINKPGDAGYEAIRDPFIPTFTDNPGQQQVQVRQNLSNLAGTAIFTASISGKTLTVTGMSTGVIALDQVLTGSGINNQTVILSQLSGTTGGVGTYKISPAQTVSSTIMTSGMFDLTGSLQNPSRFSIAGKNWTCVTLNRAAASLGVSEFLDTVPSICNGLQAMSNTGVIVTLSTGQTVASFPTYHEMNIRVDIQWVVPGLSFTVIGGAPGVHSVSELMGLRLSKKLLPGDALTIDDAYELRYAGPSLWSGPCPVKFDKDGNPLELYAATGQSHKVPYDEVLFFDSDYSAAPWPSANTMPSPPRVPPRSNFYDRQQLISDAVQSGNVPSIRAAEDATVLFQEQRALLAKVAISPRGMMNRVDSIMCINLRPGQVGQELWYFKADGFDAWQSYQGTSALPNVASGRSAGVANGMVNARHFLEQPAGIDGDFGQRCCLVEGNYGHGDKDKIVWANKQGHGGVLELTDANLGPSSFSIKYWKYLGPTSSLGGANYGSAVDDTKLYTLQRNMSGDLIVPLRDPSYPSNPDLTQSKNFYWPYDYVSQANPTRTYVKGQSYISALNIYSGRIEWEELLSPPSYVATTAIRGGGLSCTPGLVVATAYDNNGRLRFFDSSNGDVVTEFPQEAGNGWVGIADNEIYAYNGRPFAGGLATQYLRVYSLQ